MHDNDFFLKIILFRINETMLNERLGHRNDTSGPKESCEVVLEYCLVKRSDMATLSKYIIISLAGIQLLKEIFQITQVSELKKSLCMYIG